MSCLASLWSRGGARPKIVQRLCIGILDSEFLHQFLLNFGRGLSVNALAVIWSFRSAARGAHLNAHDIARGLDGGTVGAAIVPDVIVIRHHGDIRCPPSVVPDEPYNRVVAAMRAPGEDASDPGQALIAGPRESEVAVKNDDTLHGRGTQDTTGQQKSEL